MLHDVGNNRDCDVDVDHRNNTRNVCGGWWCVCDLSSILLMSVEHRRCQSVVRRVKCDTCVWWCLGTGVDGEVW